MAVAATAAINAVPETEEAAAKPLEEDSRSMAAVTMDVKTVEEKSDIIWAVLKSFSLLAVRERTGSMHRLLQQAVMDLNSKEAAKEAIGRCLWTLSQLWCFCKDSPDTWEVAGQLVEHINVTTKNAVALNVDPLLCAKLLTDAGIYISIAWSTFHKAQRVLERAMQVYASVPNCPGADKAKALHHLGMVMRYQGDYNRAEAFLTEALGLHSVNDLQMAETLKDLGIVRIKQQDLDGAETYLLRSLTIVETYKRANATTSPTGRRSADSIHEVERNISLANAAIASTLYQLAKLAVVRKPPRLDDAERLLRQVMSTKGLEGATRSATLQQQGRVAIRRGQLNDAETYFQQALAGYQETYRKDCHVNIASVHHALGMLGATRKLYDTAAKHLLDALRIRTTIYGSQANHMDLATTLFELGKNCRMQGKFEEAAQYLHRYWDMLNSMLKANKGSSRIGNDLVTATRMLRAVAKSMNDKPAVKLWSDALQDFKQYSAGGEVELDAPNETVPVVLQNIVMLGQQCRDDVRKELLVALRASRRADSDVIGSAVEPLHHELAKIPARPSHIIIQNMMQQHLDSRCVLDVFISDSSTFLVVCVPTKTRLESSIEKITPHLIYDRFSGGVE